MLNGYKIIDANSHVIEPLDMWFKYLEPEFKESEYFRRQCFIFIEPSE